MRQKAIDQSLSCRGMAQSSQTAYPNTPISGRISFPDMLGTGMTPRTIRAKAAVALALGCATAPIRGSPFFPGGALAG